jgi:hypothetical protein
MTRRLVALAAVVALALAACSDDDGEAADPATTEPPATTEAPTTTETTEAPPEDDSCPDDAPVPATATDVVTATLAYDGDGDGAPDALNVFRFEGDWWLQVEWAAGGSAAVTIDDVSEAFGAKPLGGFDVNGNGSDEAFIAMGGPASGQIVGVYWTTGCGIWPVLDADSGLPFGFPVTASIGTFSGATCDGLGDLDLFTGELVDADEGEYLVAQAPYTLDDDGQMTAQLGDAGSIGFDEVESYSSLDCGLLAGAL